MSKHTCTLYIQGRRDYNNEVKYLINGSDMSAYGYVPVKTIDVEFEVPDDFNFVEGEIAILQDAKRRIQAEAHGKAMLIEDQIRKLQYLTYVPEEA